MYLSSSVLVVILVFTSTESSDEVSEHLINAYAPPAVNFHEIFSNSISMLAEDPTLTTGTKEEDFHIQILPTQFVEFHSQKLETSTVISTTTPTPPPPKYILNSSYLKKANASRSTTSSSTTSTTPTPVTSTTEKLEECHNIQVIPIKHERDVQRGVLDLLFPKSRVRTFKGVFDTVRKILSHTFRKR